MKTAREILQRLMTSTDDLGDSGINQAKADGYEKILDQALQDLSELLVSKMPEKKKLPTSVYQNIGDGYSDQRIGWKNGYNDATQECIEVIRKELK